MTYSTIRLATLTFLALQAGSASVTTPYPPQAAKEGSSSLQTLADGVYLSAGNPQGESVSNAGVIDMGDCFAVFDSHFTPAAGRALAGAIAALGNKPTRYIIYSHYHTDHTHGTQALQGVMQIIASPQTRRDILQRDVPSLSRMLGAAQSQIEKISKDLSQAQIPTQKEAMKSQLASREAFVRRLSELKIRAPVIAAEGKMSLWDGGRELRILQLGRGHTDGDLILLLPQQKIAFLGDLFFSRAIPNMQDAWVLDWIATLEETLKLPADRFVPGHGPVGNRKDVEEFLNYLKELKRIVEEAIARGETLEQIVSEARLSERYRSYEFQDFYPANLQRTYAELKAAPAQEGPPAKPDGTRPAP